MKTIKKSKLTEVLKSKGLSEGFLDKFFTKLKKARKEKEYEKLTQDPEYQALLKKHNLKPVDYLKKNSLSDLGTAVKY